MSIALPKETTEKLNIINTTTWKYDRERRREIEKILNADEANYRGYFFDQVPDMSYRYSLYI